MYEENYFYSKSGKDFYLVLEVVLTFDKWLILFCTLYLHFAVYDLWHLVILGHRGSALLFKYRI